MSRNTIVLQGDLGAHYKEALAGGTIKPGHLGKLNASGYVVVHDMRGGRVERLFPIEDALQGRTVSDAYSNAELCRYVLAAPGDVVQGVIKSGEVLVIGDKLMSAGDGTLVKAAALVLANVVADSTAITASTESTFSNGSASIAANTLAAGDRIRVRARGIITAQTSTETTTIKLKLGLSGSTASQLTTVVSTGAVDPASNDIFLAEAVITIRVAGASGYFVGGGPTYLGTPSASATAADVPTASSVASTAVDTTAALQVACTCTNSNTGESVTLNEFTVDILKAGTDAVDPSGTFVPVAVVQEALTASGDTLSPVRVI